MLTSVPSRALRSIPSRHLAILVVGVVLVLGGAVAFALGADEVAVGAFALFGALFFAIAIHLHARGVAPTTQGQDLVALADQMTPTITRTVARDWSVNAMRISARYEVMEERLEAVLAELAERGAELEALRGTLAEQHAPTLSRLRRLTDDVVSDVDALFQLQDRHAVDGGAPVLGGWALNPVPMLTILDLVDERDCETVVECGSGASTYYLAASFRRRGRGRVVALEHLADQCAAAQRGLERLGLAEYAEVRHAPLRDVVVDGESFSWYDPGQVSDLADIDLLLVDGPPKAVGDRARYPAVPVLGDRLSADAVVVVDDANRPDERDVITQWCDEQGWRRDDPGGHFAVLVRADAETPGPA